ncbi:unnamed protein product [Closterium sp. NIES-54]
MHTMALRPSSVPQRVAVPSPLASSLPNVPHPESDLARAASPTVTRLLATVVTNPSLESTAASALVIELVDFAATSCLDNVASLFSKSGSVCPPSARGELALSSNVLQVRQVELECLAAALPRFVTMLPCPEGDPDALDIPTACSYVEAITAQCDYKLHSLDFSTAILKGSLHKEIWLRRPPGFTGSFPEGTLWSLWRPVYGLRQALREWHDTLRTTLAALGFAPLSTNPSMFLHTDRTLPPFYILVYVDDLVFAIADTEALALVNTNCRRDTPALTWEVEAGGGAQEESRGEAAGGEEIGGGEAAGGEERRGGWGRGERRGGCLVIPATPTPLPPPPHYSRGGKGREKEAVGAVCTFPPPPHPPPHSSRCGSEREAAEREVRGSWGLEHPLILSRQSHHPHLRVSTVAGCGREEGGERAGTGGGIHHLPCHSGNRAYNNNRPYTTYRASSCSLPPTLLRFDADSRALNFPTWLLRAELYLQRQRQDGNMLWAHASNDPPSPPRPADLSLEHTAEEQERYTQSCMALSEWQFALPRTACGAPLRNTLMKLLRQRSLLSMRLPLLLLSTPITATSTFCATKRSSTRRHTGTTTPASSSTTTTPTSSATPATLATPTASATSTAPTTPTPLTPTPVAPLARSGRRTNLSTKKVNNSSSGGNRGRLKGGSAALKKGGARVATRSSYSAVHGGLVLSHKIWRESSTVATVKGAQIGHEVSYSGDV